jgi:hypothetical protein
MNQDKVQRDAVFRGNLLEVSSFLTKLQSHLVPEGLARVVPSDATENEGPPGDENNKADVLVVMPQDLKKVLQYRRLLAEEEEILHSIAAAEEMARSNNVLSKLSLMIIAHIKVDLENHRAKLKECTTTRTKRIHLLWTRMEVWWTKLVAQQVLVAPVKDFSEDPSRVVDCCFSPLMNLPGSKHFRAILPEPADGLEHSVNEKASAFYQNTLPCCSLPLPPNKHTWREFARISRMVSLLERKPEDGRRTRNRSPHEQAFRSPCCVHDALVNKSKHIQAAQVQYFDFAAPHLVALWVRAQRNTQAMRHLWMIFDVRAEVDTAASPQAALKVRGGGARGSGKYLVMDSPQEAGPSDDQGETIVPIKTRSFVPVLRGNPNHIRNRIVDVSKLVDQLVEWTVTNQVLFTHKQIQKYLMMSPGFQKDDEIDSLIEMEQRHRKRVRQDFSQGSDLVALKAACLSFVLRWFARRNRSIISYLFDSSTENYSLDFGWTESDESFNELFPEVQRTVKRLLLEKEGEDDSKVYPADRTLTRVDRRTEFHYTVNYEIDGITLLDQVKALLEALGESARWDARQHAQIQSAKQDMDKMYTCFLGRSRDVYDIASNLVNKQTDSAKEMTDMLQSAPKPWPNCCSVCLVREGVREGALVSCTNCEKVYHSRTCSAGHIKLKFAEVAASQEPLRRLCQLKRPREIIRIPDYTNDDSLKQEEVTIDIERELNENGYVAPLGLTLRTVEECATPFDKLNSDTATVLDLVEILNDDARRQKMTFPIKGIRGAFVIVDTKDAIGKAAGIKIGDIVLSVEHLQIPNPEQAAKYGRLGVVDFAGIPIASRMQYLKVCSTKLRITVLRPNTNIVWESKKWFGSLKRLNKILTAPDFWYCQDCLVTNMSSDSLEPSGNAVVKDALRCRATIRRIGMESYALPFFDENVFGIQTALNSGQETDGMFFSLRRLDAMMSSIIEQQSSEDSKRLFSASFKLPPWASNDGTTRRIGWAPEVLEDRPVDLLISALLAWQEVDELDESRKSSRMKAIRHFLLLVTSWCVLPSACTTSLQRTKGPPELFLYLREPWLCRSCLFCCSQPRDDGSVACRNVACSKMTQTDFVNMDGVGHEEAQKVLHETAEYNECSSLVGTTFLVVPDDPLVHALKPIVGGIDHQGRPMEFIVASYLPPAFVSESILKKPKDIYCDKFGDNEGVFHLLPVLNANQLAYLLANCKTRRKFNGRNDCRDLSWVSLDVLNERGVARYSMKELKNKLTESDSIRRSIDEWVATENGADDIEANVAFSGSQWSLKSDRGSSVPLSEMEANTVGSQKHLVDRFLQTVACPESIRQALSSGIAREPDGPVWESEFGESHVQEGLLITNSTPIVLDIVKPSGTGCILLYSDLHYSLPAEMPSLIEALVPKSLHQIERSPESTIMTILLQRSDPPQPSEDYKGVGFGFEVVRWGRDKSLHIGRVHRRSPAFSAGLKAGDILLSAGGKDMAGLTSTSELVTVLAGAPIHIRLAPQSDDPLRLVLSAVRESKVALDSVVLVIERPKQVVRSTQSVQIPEQDIQERLRATQRIQNAQQPVQQGAPSETEPDDYDPVSIWDHSIDRNPPDQSARSQGNSDAGISGTPPPKESRDSLAQQLVVNPTIVRQSHIDAASAGRSGPRNPQYAAALGPPPVLPVYQKPAGQVQQQQHSHGHRPGRTFPNLSILFRLLIAIGSSAEPRTTATFGHLYRPAGGDSILTLMEASLFLECLQNRQPKLGIRLLCPRYELKVVLQQGAIIASWTEQQVCTIPRLSRSVYDALVNLDYKRTTNLTKPEVGPEIFREGPYAYKAPVDILPVDRATERRLQIEREQQDAQRQALEAHYQSTIDAGYDAPAHFSPAPPTQWHTTHEEHASGYHHGANQANAHGHSPRMHSVQRSDHWAGPVQASNSFGGSSDERFVPPPNIAPIPNPLQASNPFGGSADHAIALDDDGDESNQGFAQRIRGGGPLEGLNGAYVDASSPELEQQGDCLVSSSDGPQDAKDLNQVPLEEWTGLAVYTFVATATDGASSETMMVGWVKNAESSDGELPETVQVEAYYLASIGYFTSPKIFDLYPEDVFVVDENSETEEATVITRLRAKGNAPTAVESPSQNTAPLYHESALAYAKSLGEGMKILGDVPDGREVVWCSNDPSALYLAKNHQEEALRAAFQHYADSIGQRTDSLPLSCPKLSVRIGELCCPWGCSVQMNTDNESRDCLFFDSIDDFRIHCDNCHSYGPIAEIVELGDGKLFTRVHEGVGMLQLISDISSAIVACLPSVWPDAVKKTLVRMKLPSGTEFAQSPTGEKLSLPWTNNSLRTKVSEMVRQSNNRHLLSVVDLWSTMGHLFEIDGSGLFRLTQAEFEAATAHHHTIRANEHDHIANCCQYIPSSTNPRSFLDCALCSLPWEKCIGKPANTSNMDEGSGTSNHFRGLGCVLRSDSSFQKSNISNAVSLPGTMGEAKALLLQVAELIPPGLKLSNPIGKSDPLEGRRIWDTSYLDVWKAFVWECSNPSMLSQALTVLLGSINRTKMPRWWKQEGGGGWSTSQVIMANTSMETFFLHLYVLDAALSETIGRSFLAQASTEPTPTSTEDRSLLLKSLGRRMALYMSFAQELKESPYTREHDEDCMYCLEGGDLLCCEFCDYVAHAKCLDPPLQKEEADNLENWVCDSCMNDLCEKKGVQRDDIERQYPLTETKGASSDG